MGIVEGIKDSARKTTNNVVDAAEGMMGIQKSPKELAKRLVEHLSHGEYSVIAKLISEEADKAITNLGLDNVDLIKGQLEEFEEEVGDLAEEFENNNYTEIADKLRKYEASIPDKDQGSSGTIFKLLKKFLNTLAEGLEKYHEDKDKGFSNLESQFEEYFNLLLTNNKEKNHDEKNK